MNDDNTVKKHSEMTASDWIVYRWAEVTWMSDSEPRYARGLPRPLDEAMKLAGGSIKDLEPHLAKLGVKA
jgi:hypothetical protein